MRGLVRMLRIGSWFVYYVYKKNPQRYKCVCKCVFTALYLQVKRKKMDLTEKTSVGPINMPQS